MTPAPARAPMDAEESDLSFDWEGMEVTNPARAAITMSADRETMWRGATEQDTPGIDYRTIAQGAFSEVTALRAALADAEREIAKLRGVEK